MGVYLAFQLDKLPQADENHLDVSIKRDVLFANIRPFPPPTHQLSPGTVCVLCAVWGGTAVSISNSSALARYCLYSLGEVSGTAVSTRILIALRLGKTAVTKQTYGAFWLVLI